VSAADGLLSEGASARHGMSGKTAGPGPVLHGDPAGHRRSAGEAVHPSAAGVLLAFDTSAGRERCANAAVF